MNMEKTEEYPTIGYRTEYKRKVKKRKGPDKGKVVNEKHEYVTKSLTDVHRGIHDDPKNTDVATYHMKDVPDWPFPPFTEMIEIDEKR